MGGSAIKGKYRDVHNVPVVAVEDDPEGERPGRGQAQGEATSKHGVLLKDASAGVAIGTPAISL